MATPKKRTTAGEWAPAFLAALRASANVRASCQAAGISRREAYRHRERSAAFREQWDDALNDAVDSLEAVARKRAVEASDTLLIFLLKSHRPSVYRETYRHQHEGAEGGPLTLVVRVVDDRAD
jgi:hypothetical protein